MQEKTCSLLSHKKIKIKQLKYFKAGINEEIEKAIADGYTRFLCNFENETDHYFAKLVTDKCKQQKNLRLEAILPYRSRLSILSKNKNIKILLDACSSLRFINEMNSPYAYIIVKRYMINNSERILVVCDGCQTGNQMVTIKLEPMQNKELRAVYLCLPEQPASD